jgi:hypothetical protein
MRIPKERRNENTVRKFSVSPKAWITANVARNVRGTVTLEIIPWRRPRKSRRRRKTRMLVLKNSR